MWLFKRKERWRMSDVSSFPIPTQTLRYQVSDLAEIGRPNLKVVWTGWKLMFDAPGDKKQPSPPVMRAVLPPLLQVDALRGKDEQEKLAVLLHITELVEENDSVKEAALTSGLTTAVSESVQASTISTAEQQQVRLLSTAHKCTGSLACPESWKTKCMFDGPTTTSCLAQTSFGSTSCNQACVGNWSVQMLRPTSPPLIIAQNLARGFGKHCANTLDCPPIARRL